MHIIDALVAMRDNKVIAVNNLYPNKHYKLYKENLVCHENEVDLSGQWKLSDLSYQEFTADWEVIDNRTDNPT